MDNAIDISAYTTFQLSSKVQKVLVFKGGDIKSLLDQVPNEHSIFVLGGGSNIILPPELADRTVVKIENKGINIVDEDDSSVTLKVASGELWDDVVAHAVHNGYSGIEALSAIPGITGATPIQNVGAYGAEIKDVLVSLEAYDIKKKEMVTILNAECEFAYRASIFKKEWKNKFIIIDISLKLSKLPPTVPDYKGVEEYFKTRNIVNPSLQEIRDAIIEIRWSKLPHPEALPNCGSFFENPIVSMIVYEKIKALYSNVPSFKISARQDLAGGKVKIPAGWLIENAELKGVNFGSVGTYEKNAIVLINCGTATQADVISARDQIIDEVYKKFGIRLESEPEIIK